MPEARAVAVEILKGGMGKTVISLNLAHTLQERGHDVLLMDLDPNGPLTYHLGFTEEYESDVNLGDVILSDATMPPGDMIRSTDFGVDFVPSSFDLENLHIALANETMGSQLLDQNFVEPLLDDQYDYIVMDCPNDRGRIPDNALVAAQNIIIPVKPGHGTFNGVKETVSRQLVPIRKHMPLNLLAVVPNQLSDRIDVQTSDRELLERINAHDELQPAIPSFARFAADDWKAIDAGKPHDLPGIRDRTAIDQALGEGLPVAEYDSMCDQIQHFDTLAAVVENGGPIDG